jgi:hypothetical protein
MRVGFLLSFLHNAGEVIELEQVFGGAHGHLVVFKDVLAILELLAGFVASADVVSEKQLVGLDVRVNVDEVQEIKLKELVHRVPVLVALDL